jgi:RHS repeat-associated protein
MSYFGQSIENEYFSTLVPIERFYPDLAPNTVSNATPESTSEPLFQGTRILYWYHPDYVSNVDLVTDVNGEAYELFLYNAWGESLHHWTSNSSNSWSSPYRFNSKELDPETGMHYYGARYHHPKLSVWMSVDPLASQNLNQYQFTGNNPLMYLDPDGRDTVFATLNDDLWTISSTSISEGSDYIALTVDGETEYHEFNEGEYGNRVNVLNIESTQEVRFGVRAISLNCVDLRGPITQKHLYCVEFLRVASRFDSFPKSLSLRT